MTEIKIKQKVDELHRFVKTVVSNHQKPVVACSFGKNSMIVLDVVRQYLPDVHVLFNDTLMEYPDTYEFKNKISKNWKLNLLVTKPSKTFWWVVENYGYPLFSRKGHKDASKNCCRYLKEYPIEKILRKYKFDLYFTGLSRHESRLREFSARKYGNYFYSKRNKHWKCHPIQDWNENDVWKYHKLFKIPHNSFYDKQPPDGFIMRTGCWCCTIPVKYGKIEFLRLYYPKLWRLLITKGFGKVFLEGKIGKKPASSQIKDLIENSPCFFDRY